MFSSWTTQTGLAIGQCLQSIQLNPSGVMTYRAGSVGALPILGHESDFENRIANIVSMAATLYPLGPGGRLNLGPSYLHPRRRLMISELGRRPVELHDPENVERRLNMDRFFLGAAEYVSHQSSDPQGHMWSLDVFLHPGTDSIGHVQLLHGLRTDTLEVMQQHFTRHTEDGDYSVGQEWILNLYRNVHFARMFGVDERNFTLSHPVMLGMQLATRAYAGEPTAYAQGFTILPRHGPRVRMHLEPAGDDKVNLRFHNGRLGELEMLDVLRLLQRIGEDFMIFEGEEVLKADTRITFHHQLERFGIQQAMDLKKGTGGRLWISPLVERALRMIREADAADRLPS